MKRQVKKERENERERGKEKKRVKKKEKREICYFKISLKKFVFCKVN